MFNKKELEDIQQELKKIHNNHETHHKETKEHLDKTLEQVKKEIADIKTKQHSHYDELDKSLTAFNDLNTRYRKEFDTLTLLKNQITEKVLEKLDKELKQGLQKHLDALKTEKDSFKQLNEELDKMKAEIQRLTGISQKIKEADLDLKASANKIAEQEEEKSKLIRRLSDLQDIIAKNRQKRSLY